MAMTIILAVWLFAHGVAHPPGFLVSWQLWTSPELPFHTPILASTVDVGTTGIGMIGVGWLVGAVGFVALAVTAVRAGS